MASSDADLPGYDVIVIGGGAAGLLAATRSAERGRRALVLEKNRKPGVKILMSGGTRCNITHDCEAAGIIAGFGSAGTFLHSSLAALSPSDLIELLNAEGLATKVEPGGKIFPTSDRAADVLEALLKRLRRSGAELALGEAVQEILLADDSFEEAGHLSDQPEQRSFRVTTSHRTIRAARVVLTTGGKSYPGCGTTGDGYVWLAALGHTIRQPRPALVPLTSDDAWVRELSGVTIADAVVRVMDFQAGASRTAAQRRGCLPPGVLIERRGGLLFTHFGLSGPAILDVSRAVTGAADLRRLMLVVDFLPSITAESLDESFRNSAQAAGKKLVGSVVAEQLPRRLVDALMARVQTPPERRLAELSKVERGLLIEELKRCPIRITGSRGFDKAEVTAGGVALDEVDSRTMESKLVPGLFIAGEILDLDGFIGGYNFQAAFSTGWLAGESV